MILHFIPRIYLRNYYFLAGREYILLWKEIDQHILKIMVWNSISERFQVYIWWTERVYYKLQWFIDFLYTYLPNRRRRECKFWNYLLTFTWRFKLLFFFCFIQFKRLLFYLFWADSGFRVCVILSWWDECGVHTQIIGSWRVIFQYVYAEEHNPKKHINLWKLGAIVLWLFPREIKLFQILLHLSTHIKGDSILH